MKRGCYVIFLLLIVFAATCGNLYASLYVLSSTPDGKGVIVADDDITITLETSSGANIVLVNDEDRNKTYIDPITFKAQEGDKLVIQVVDYPKEPIFIGSRVRAKGHKELSPLYLTNVKTGKYFLIFAGFHKHHSNWQVGGDTFVSLSYTIGTPLKTYCLSSTPNECSPIGFSDDFPLFKIESESYSLELHPDGDGDPSTHLLTDVQLPLNLNNATVEYQFSNTYGDAFAGPMYLVPKDGHGKSITLLDRTINVSGKCKSFISCPTVIFYSYNGPLVTNISYWENDQFTVEYEPLDDPDYYGFWVGVTLLKPPPIPMYIYFTEPDGKNVFLTPKGMRYKGSPLSIEKNFESEYKIPKDMSYQENLFISGNYACNIADSTGRFIYSYNFTIDTLSFDIEKIQEPSDSCTYMRNNSSPTPISGEEEYITTLLQETCANRDELLDKQFSFTTISSDNTTVTCTVYTANGDGTFENSLIPIPVTTSDYKLYFLTYIECSSTNATENATEEYPQFIMGLDYGEGDETYISIEAYSEDLPTLDGINGCPGRFYYLYIPLVNVTKPKNITYSLSFTTDKKNTSSGNIFSPHTSSSSTASRYTWKIGAYTQTIHPVEFKVESAPGYINGATLKFNVSSGGILYSYMNFGIKITSLNGSSIDPDMFVVYAVVREGSNTVVRIPLEGSEDGIFKSSIPLPIPKDITEISYSFSVKHKMGKSITGLILQNAFQMTISTGDYPLVIRIGGKNKLTLGDYASFTFFLQTGDFLNDFPFDIYLGLYKKGRGVVWLITNIKGAWILSTSAEKKPLVSDVRFKDFKDGRYMFVNLKLPNDCDPNGLLYPGEYMWILQVEPKEEVCQTSTFQPVCSSFCFKIEPPR